MEWLTLTLEDHFNGMLGEAAVKVTGLGETTPFAGRVTFVQVSCLIVGKATISQLVAAQRGYIRGPHYLSRPSAIVI